MSDEAEIEKVKARLRGLGELGRLTKAKLGWLYDQRNMAEIFEKAKKGIPSILKTKEKYLKMIGEQKLKDLEEQGGLWVKKNEALTLMIALYYKDDLLEFLEKWFGEPQK